MPSGVFDSILLRDSWSTAELRAVFSDENRVQKWYEVEATLASEQAAFGIVPREAAGDIMRNAKVEKVDLAEIARAMGEAKHPLVPALRALQKLCKPELGEWLHYGPTTQDILDGLYRLDGDDLGGIVGKLRFSPGKPAKPVACGWTVVAQKGQFVSDGKMFCVKGLEP